MTGNTSKSSRNVIKKYPLGSFFVLSYVLFICAIMVIGAIVSLSDISDIGMGILIACAAWTPNLAAFTVTWAVDGRMGVVNLLRGWTKWKVHVAWYLFGVSPLIIALVVGKTYSLAVGVDSTSQVSTSTLVLMIFFHTIQGATGEELGWRGYALPRLQSRYSVLGSAVILGVLIAGWHTLLHLVSPIGIPEWQFWLLMVSYSVLVTWGYNNSRGSVLVVTIFHFAFNFSFELVTTKLGWIPFEVLFAIRTGVYFVLAILVVIVGGLGKVSGKKKAA